MRRRHSLNNIMRRISVGIMIPVLVLIVLIGWKNHRDNLEQKLQENQTDADMLAADLDTLLELAEGTLGNIAGNDADFELVASAEEESTEFWLANQRIMEKLSVMEDTTPLNLNFFAYYPKNDMFYNYRKDETIAACLQDELLHEKTSVRQQGWHTVETGVQAYLVYLLDYHDYYVGAWGDLNTVFASRIANTGEAVDVVFLKVDQEPFAGSEYQYEKNKPFWQSADGRVWYLAAAEVSGADLQIGRLEERSFLEAQIPGVTGDLLLVILVFAILFAAYTVFIRRYVLQPIQHLERSIEQLQASKVLQRMEPIPNDSSEFLDVIQTFNNFMDHIESLKIEVYESKLTQNETKLEYLSRQIQPHFILNTLNTIYNYSGRDVETTKKLIRLTSRYYQYVVRVNSKYVPLGDEFAHIEDYLSLQKIRYPQNFTYEVICDDELKIVPVPPFVIESFVGNAIKHGICTDRPSRILVEAEKVHPFQVCIRVSDTGAGFSEDSLDAIREFMETGEVSEELGVGIRNSIERLHLIYGDRASVSVYNQASGGAVVEIEIQLQENTDGN